MHRLPLLALLALVPFPGRAAAPGAEAAKLRFAPAAGSAWVKTLGGSSEMELSEFRVEMGGAPVPSEFLPRMELRWSEASEVVLHDVFLELGEGQPLRLRRTYEEVSCTMGSYFSMEGDPDGPQEDSLEPPSGLAGRTVEFVRDAETGATRADWIGGAGPDELLASLVEDRDLRRLLPGEPPAEGASWTVPAEAIADLFDPLADLGLEIPAEARQAWRPVYDEERVEGELLLTWAATENGGDASLATIRIRGEIVYTGVCPGDLSEVPVASGEATQVDTLETEVEGTLVWDLTAGVARSLELRLDSELESRTTKDDGEPAYAHTLRFRGSGEIAFHCSPE